MTKFNLNPNFKTRKRIFPLKNILKPVYLSIILIAILIIIMVLTNNKIESIKLQMLSKHPIILSNAVYKKDANDLNVAKINTYINKTQSEIFMYKFKMVHQNVQSTLKKLSDSYSKYLPAGFILHSFTYKVDSNNSSETSIEIDYLKDYMDEVKTFSYSARNYINKIILKDFDNNEKK